MKCNMGTADRTIRSLIGLVALVVSFLVGSLAWQIALWVVAGLMFITSAFGICPAYMPFRWSTRKK